MAVQLTYLGHSGFLLTDGSTTVAVDPFLTGNPLVTLLPEKIACQYIALTHGHSDHVGDTLTIAQRNNATLVAAWEICEHFSGNHGIEVSPGNPGGQLPFDFGWIAFTKAFHSSSYEGQYMGMPCGLVINIGGITIYHCGDTDLFGDMKLVGEIYRPDIALVPIGDRFTMGPALASKAAEWIKPRVAIPIHYNTFAMIEQDPSRFTPEGVAVKVMKPGEAWDYEMA